MKEYIDKLVMIILRDKKMLMVREYGQDVPFLVGGKRHAGESDVEALVREVREELGVECVGSSLQYFSTFETPAVGKPEHILVRGTCYFGELADVPRASSEIEEVMYVAYEDRPLSNQLACTVFEALRAAGHM